MKTLNRDGCGLCAGWLNQKLDTLLAAAAIFSLRSGGCPPFGAQAPVEEGLVAMDKVFPARIKVAPMRPCGLPIKNEPESDSRPEQVGPKLARWG